jgi:hypothetical protein
MSSDCQTEHIIINRCEGALDLGSDCRVPGWWPGVDCLPGRMNIHQCYIWIGNRVCEAMRPWRVDGEVSASFQHLFILFCVFEIEPQSLIGHCNIVVVLSTPILYSKDPGLEHPQCITRSWLIGVSWYFGAITRKPWDRGAKTLPYTFLLIHESH